MPVYKIIGLVQNWTMYPVYPVKNKTYAAGETDNCLYDLGI